MHRLPTNRTILSPFVYINAVSRELISRLSAIKKNTEKCEPFIFKLPWLGTQSKKENRLSDNERQDTLLTKVFHQFGLHKIG